MIADENRISLVSKAHFASSIFVNKKNVQVRLGIRSSSGYSPTCGGELAYRSTVENPLKIIPVHTPKHLLVHGGVSHLKPPTTYLHLKTCWILDTQKNSESELQKVRLTIAED